MLATVYFVVVKCYYVDVLIGRIKGLPVRLSICLVQVLILKTIYRKIKISAKVPQV